jgi:O-antigen/teichoic acid export membrane protein
MRSTTWLSIGAICEYGITFLTMVWLARLISPAEFGVASLTISFLAFARLFSDLAMGPALIRREVVEQAHTDVAFISAMTLAMLASTCTLLAAPFIASYFSTPQLQPMCWVIAALIPIHAALSIAYAILSRQSEFKFLAVSTLPGLIIGYAVTSIFLAMRGFGAWSILIGSIVQYGLTVIIMYSRAGYLPSFHWNGSAFRELISFSFGQSVSQIVNQIALSGDNLIVGRALGMGPLGLYGRAYKLMELPVAILSTALFKVLFPLMSSIQAKKERLAEAYLAALQGLLTIFIPTSVFLIFSAEPLVFLVLGPKWDGAVLPFQTLCISLAFRAAYRHVNLPPLISGHTARLTLLSTLYAMWVIGGAIIAVKLVGTIEAVAVAVSIAILLHYLASAWFTNQQLRIKMLDFAKLHLPGFSIGCVLAVSLSLAHAMPSYRGKSVGSVAIDACISVVVIAICLYLWPRWFLGTRILSLLATVSESVPVGRQPFESWLAKNNRPCMKPQSPLL